MQNYSPEQVEDIQGRQIKAVESLKELELFPSAQLSSKNMGDDVFGFKITMTLQDTKYSSKENVPESHPVVEAEIVPETPVDNPTIDSVNPQPEA